MASTGKRQFWIFRLVSSRGSDHMRCFSFPAGTKKDRVKKVADYWSDKILAGSAIEHCTVSYRRVSRPSTTQLKKRWDRVCKAYRKAETAKNECRELLQATEVEKTIWR